MWRKIFLMTLWLNCLRTSCVSTGNSLVSSILNLQAEKKLRPQTLRSKLIACCKWQAVRSTLKTAKGTTSSTLQRSKLWGLLLKKLMVRRCCAPTVIDMRWNVSVRLSLSPECSTVHRRLFVIGMKERSRCCSLIRHLAVTDLTCRTEATSLSFSPARGLSNYTIRSLSVSARSARLRQAMIVRPSFTTL